MLHKTAKNILWYGECSCLQHWNHLYSWERITQTIGINKCSIYLRNWCPNKMRSMERKQLFWTTLHGSICLWLVMNRSSVFSAQKSTYFQILYCVLVRYTRTPNQTLHGNKDWSDSKLHRNTELWTELMVSQWISSGISSQDSIRCSSVKKFNSSCQKWTISQKNLKDGSSSCRCSATSHGDQETTK